MITQKEMQYIDLWAQKIPMPGIDYSNLVMKNMKDCYDKFKEKYMNKEYTFIFSNGEEINFVILNINLCHLLGIDYNNIKGEYFDWYRKDVLHMTSSDFSSFDLLEAIFEYSDKVIELDNSSNNKAKLINYYKSQIKCNIFNKLSDFEKFNFLAINYDPNDGKYDYENQKVLFIPSNEILYPYFMMGLKLDTITLEREGFRRFVPSTLFAMQECKKFFDDQEAMFPTKIFVSDDFKLNAYTASAEDKIRLLTMYKAIISKYGIINRLNISGDYEAMLNEIANSNGFQKVKK